MSQSVVTSSKVSEHATGVAVTSAVDTTGANTLVVAVQYRSGKFSSFVDSASNTWTQIDVESALLSAAQRIRFYYAKNAATSTTHTFTLTQTSADYGGIVMVALGGMDATAPLDQNSTIDIDTAATSHTTGSITTTQANEIIVAFGEIYNSSTVSDGSGGTYTVQQSQASGTEVGMILVTRLVTATGTFSYTFNTGSSVATGYGIASFKEAAGGSAATYPQLERGRRGILRGVAMGDY